VRLVDTAFRCWWLVVIPLVVLPLMGAASAMSHADIYESAAVIGAEDDTVLGGLTGSSSTAWSWETPAQVAARRINELLGTDSFAASVAASAGVDNGSVEGLQTTGDVRGAVAAYASGENLVVVRARTADPVASKQLVVATIDSFVQEVIDSVGAESAAAEEYFRELLARYETEYDDATDELEKYLVDHPEPPVGERPIGEQIVVSRLTSAAERAEANVVQTQRSLEQAQLTAEQERADMQQRLRLIDEPYVPGAPISSNRGAIISFVLYVALGLILAVGGVVLVTVVDRTVRRGDEVREWYGVDALATVPEIGRHRIELQLRSLDPPAIDPDETVEATA
jgi:hypothetical protein